MNELRRRKLKSGAQKEREKSSAVSTSDSTRSDLLGETRSSSCWLQAVSALVGIFIAFFVGYKYALYAKELHENDMWFSNIGQVEREISFRTESGLYFSYYKQLVLAPSLSQGLYELTHDNVTEHLRTINILERFNIYQEVILAILYRTIPNIKASYEYVYFYLNCIFGLHGLYMVALYVTAWIFSDSWLAGLLAVCFYIFNKDDTTRISFTMPLRESFGFPFLFIQIAFITYYLKRDISRTVQVICVVGIAVCSFFFTIVWQFAQFILLLQCFAFFGVHSLGFAPTHKIRNLYCIVIGSLVAVCLWMFFNDMMLCSLALSFSIAGLLLMAFQKNETLSTSPWPYKLLRLLLNILVVLFLMFAISSLIKFVLKVESDEHIFKFVKAKLGYNIGRDFDSLLYLCEPAFQILPTNTYGRLISGVVFPCYALSLGTVLLLLADTVSRNWSCTTPSNNNEEHDSTTTENPTPPLSALNCQPEVVYSTIQTVMFGLIAISTLRFKFLWTPHMCLYAAGIICHQGFWRAVLERVGLQNINISKILGHVVPALLIALVLSLRLQGKLDELKELKEFHDPDTVALMNWIKSETPPDSSFAGSMQLLAGVKLCTDRHITNHPHYENKFLRERTKQVYQVYARRTPQEVHSILQKHGADYVILENSICYSRMPSGCKLKDILDMDNGHVIEGGTIEPGLRHTSVPRFCDAIKMNLKSFTRYFRLVFENQTFYLYKVL